MEEFLLGTSSNDELWTELIQTYLDKRIIILNQGIDNHIIEDCVLYILKWNAEDKDLPAGKRQPITILFNSVGGDSFMGFHLIDIINASITPVIGVAMGLVASMAYHIYITCDERYAFSNSILLQHDGEITLQNSASKAKDTMKFLDNMELRTKSHVLSCTTMTEEFYDKIYDQEYFMYADDAKAMGCVDAIVGIDCTLDKII